MYALVDCNSFFCAVERVFHPGLRGKPVCVLSNNDGCIVALTPEAKALGLRRGVPLYQVEDIVRHGQVRVFSSNMYLYAAMSKRVVSILRQSVQAVENYSIDECFCDLRGYERHYDLTELMRTVAERVQRWTDIPVSVGVAPSKTLAKIGSKFAKQYAGYRGVCTIDTDEKRRRALALFDLGDVWGVGRSTLERLHQLGIHTPLAFADQTERWVRAHFSKPAVQTWRELNGVPCIDTAEVVRNQTICTSRSFGQMVGDLPSLCASVATFAASCASKLRGQRGGARQLTVFICSNRFREDLPQYSAAESTLLVVPTADTIEITTAALQLLDRIYRPGILYKKSGVILSDIADMRQVQQDLFDPIRNRPQRARLMQTIDQINQRYGLKTARLAVEGEAQEVWRTKSVHRSPNYLTNLADILVV